jgi:hypothetical protein
MNDTAEHIEPPTPAKPKRPYTRRAKHKPAAAKPLKVPDEFAGLTEVECCNDCNANRCVISGINVCGHPMKGGQIRTGDGAAEGRFMRAKKALAHRKIDLRGG